MSEQTNKIETLAEAVAERDKLREEVARLRLSKLKTHAWLTRIGIPECHDAEGCRAEARAKILERMLSTGMADSNHLRYLLTELVATVRGECPSLLNEDSGGSGELSTAIDEALSQPDTTNDSAA